MTTTAPQLLSADFARPLGGLEHFFSVIDRHWPVHFAMIAEIEGPTKVNAWRKGLDKLQERHPLLNVAIEQSEGQIPHFQTVSNVPIPLRITPGPEVLSWEAEVVSELSRPFNAAQVPLVRAVLMYGERESVFILTMHHSIGDGLSSAYAIRDVLRVIAGEALEPLPPMPAQEPLVYMSRLAPNDANGSEQPEPPPESRAVTYRTIDGSLPRIEALRLNSEITRTLIARARQENTTVHGALSTALVLAGRQASSDWNTSPVRVMSPFNLRRELGVGEDCGLFVWAGSVEISPISTTDFWDTARFAKSSLTARQSLNRVAQELEGLELAVNSSVGVPGAAELLGQGFASELLLTNLGKVNVQFDFGSFRLKELWGPAVLTGCEGAQTVGVTTANNSICLLHTSFKPIPSLLPRAAQILQLACK